MATSQSHSDSELDQRVINIFRLVAPPDPVNPKSWKPWRLSTLLVAIIETSNGKLDNKYSDAVEVNNALTNCEGLRDSLIAAWNKKSFADIRNLDFFQAEQPQSETGGTATGSSAPEKDLLRRLALSFRTKYYGVAVDGFYEYLAENESSFRNRGGTTYYAKFCSIVQSSGTGKSRIFTELHKKDVIVIYMNLRPMNDKRSFPARDVIPSKILTPDSDWPDAYTYEIICYAFFIALFDTLAEYLSPTRERDEIMGWVGQMCDLTQLPDHPVRDAFFGKLEKNYETIYAQLSRNGPARVKDTTGASSHSETVAVARSGMDIKQTTERSEQLTISDSVLNFTGRISSALERVSGCLDRIFPHSKKPKLVIEFDEAHPLTERRRSYSYRPANTLCRVMSVYSHAENGRDIAPWVVFASTTSKVADFSPPSDKDNSDRVSVQGQKLFAPYTQLGWDQNASRVDGTPIGDISKIDYIVGFGRPLWLSLKNAMSGPGDVFKTASYKLLGANEDFNSENTNQALAVLAQRFALDVSFGHLDSVAHLEQGVASHLRICLSTTADRSWRFTSYPSEPLLSCAAAKSLHEHPAHLEKSLKILFNVVQSGMINMGQRGELASRLLWLLAKDLYVRAKAKDLGLKDTPTKWGDHLMDCVMIPVVDWLEFVFGPQVWQSKGARKAFENAYVNFSHWVSMEENIRGSSEGPELSLYESTRRHWYRTSAVQCCHLQPRIDKMIPMYFKSDLESTTKHQLSQILICDKARTGKSDTSSSDLLSITRTHESIGGGNLGDTLPYIAILADLSRPPGFTATFPQRAGRRAAGNRALRIDAKGISVETYPFLAEYPGVEKALRDLVQLQQSPKMNEPIRQYLDMQVKFGTTTKPEHML